MKRLLLLFLALLTSRADTIEMKTGERVDGVFERATQDGAVIKVGGQTLTFSLEKIRAIYLGSALPPPVASAESPDKAALDALRALRSITSSGISLRDYSPRVLDARVTVDRYLNSASKDAPGVANISLAMRYYEIANLAWPITTTSGVNSVAPSTRLAETIRAEKDQLAGACPKIAGVVTQADAKNAKSLALAAAEAQKKPRAQNQMVLRPTDDLIIQLMLNALRPPEVWACAEKQIADAERR
jgi:hypothetical protein